VNKKFISLFKGYRGGEWFRLSLESVQPYTDGCVVIFSDGPWVDSLTLPENCSQPLAEFQAAHPDYPVVVRTKAFTRHEHQYDYGLSVIREEFGPDSAVLIVDTDEVWDGPALRTLREIVEASPRMMNFRSRIFTYLKSPLYRVYPTEADSRVPVALQDARAEATTGRCTVAGPTHLIDSIGFHHFCYVRREFADIREKFQNTSSQEKTPSKATWLDTAWPELPNGTNLHMTPGYEQVWQSMRIVVPSMLPPGAVECVPEAVRAEEDAWREKLRSTPPDSALIPVPTDADAAKYADDLLGYLGPVDRRLLHSRLQTTYLEALWLAHWASEVPGDGRILEIGCGNGGSTAVLSRAFLSRVKIDAVDPFVPYNEETYAGTARGVMEGNEAAFLDMAYQCGYADRLQHFKCSSTDVQLNQKYDLVFIDGNHSESFVKSDLELAWRVLKPGGLLVGHDYSTRFPGVIAAIDASGLPFSAAAGTSLIYARKA
jgi:predicted O-methyltransferase YrrM